MRRRPHRRVKGRPPNPTLERKAREYRSLKLMALGLRRHNSQPLHWIEVDGVPTPVESDNVLSWARWMETAERQVAVTAVDDFLVSTVFLGLDHSFGFGPPLFYETMVFYQPPELIDSRRWADLVQERYSTRQMAEAGHKEIVARVTHEFELLRARGRRELETDRMPLEKMLKLVQPPTEE